MAEVKKAEVKRCLNQILEISASSVPPCPNLSALVEFLPKFLPVFIHFYLLSSVWYTWGVRMKAGLARMEFCLTLWPLGKIWHQTFSHLIPIRPLTFSPYPVHRTFLLLLAGLFTVPSTCLGYAWWDQTTGLVYCPTRAGIISVLPTLVGLWPREGCGKEYSIHLIKIRSMDIPLWEVFSFLLYLDKV